MIFQSSGSFFILPTQIWRDSTIQSSAEFGYTEQQEFSIAILKINRNNTSSHTKYTCAHQAHVYSEQFFVYLTINLNAVHFAAYPPLKFLYTIAPVHTNDT